VPKVILTPDSPELISLLENWENSRQALSSQQIYGKRVYSAGRFQAWTKKCFVEGNDYTKDELLQDLDALEGDIEVLKVSIDDVGMIQWCQWKQNLLGIRKSSRAIDYYVIPLKKMGEIPDVTEPTVVNDSEELKQISLFKKSRWKGRKEIARVNMREIDEQFRFAEIGLSQNRNYYREQKCFRDWARKYYITLVPYANSKTYQPIINFPDQINFPPEITTHYGLGVEIAWYEFEDAVVGIEKGTTNHVRIIPKKELKNMPKFSELEKKRERDRYLNSYSPKVTSVLGIED
jgi:hypothetical protein